MKYAANNDQLIYQLLDSIKITEQDVRAPEILNSTLSSKKIFDTFGIKQRSWHGDLQDVIKLLYGGTALSKLQIKSSESSEPDAA
jgi:dTDP-4-dehydrorhamnose reductase